MPLNREAATLRLPLFLHGWPYAGPPWDGGGAWKRGSHSWRGRLLSEYEKKSKVSPEASGFCPVLAIILLAILLITYFLILLL
jgi:hypothetical protein